MREEEGERRRLGGMVGDPGKGALQRYAEASDRRRYRYHVASQVVRGWR